MLRKKRHIKTVTRILALMANDGRCKKCGAIDDLTQHHKVPKRHGGNIFSEKNVDILCRDCHRELEKEIARAERALALSTRLQERTTIGI